MRYTHKAALRKNSVLVTVKCIDSVSCMFLCSGNPQKDSTISCFEEYTTAHTLSKGLLFWRCWQVFGGHSPSPCRREPQGWHWHENQLCFKLKDWCISFLSWGKKKCNLLWPERPSKDQGLSLQTDIHLEKPLLVSYPLWVLQFNVQYPF